MKTIEDVTQALAYSASRLNMLPQLDQASLGRNGVHTIEHAGSRTNTAALSLDITVKPAAFTTDPNALLLVGELKQLLAKR